MKKTILLFVLAAAFGNLSAQIKYLSSYHDGFRMVYAVNRKSVEREKYYGYLEKQDTAKYSLFEKKTRQRRIVSLASSALLVGGITSIAVNREVNTVSLGLLAGSMGGTIYSGILGGQRMRLQYEMQDAHNLAGMQAIKPDATYLSTRPAGFRENFHKNGVPIRTETFETLLPDTESIQSDYRGYKRMRRLEWGVAAVTTGLVVMGLVWEPDLNSDQYQEALSYSFVGLSLLQIPLVRTKQKKIHAVMDAYNLGQLK